MGQLKVLAMTSVAFWPVVTRVVQWGIFCSSAGISVGVTTSRKASEALSFRRRISVAVSKNARPFLAQKARISASLKRFCVVLQKWSLSPK